MDEWVINFSRCLYRERLWPGCGRGAWAGQPLVTRHRHWVTCGRLCLWKLTAIFSSIFQIGLLIRTCLRALIPYLPHFTDREMELDSTQDISSRASLLHVCGWEFQHPASRIQSPPLSCLTPSKGSTSSILSPGFSTGKDGEYIVSQKSFWIQDTWPQVPRS